MARFNYKAASTQLTTNAAGGQAYAESPELELVSILLTSFAQDQFYKTANQTFDRLKALIAICDKRFVAQAAIYARTVFGMRSISHVAAGALAPHISGTDWGKSFYDKIIKRPDDMGEIMAAMGATKPKDVTAAMRKGFAAAIGRFNGYQLAKYRGEGKGWKMVDIVNLVHPKPTDRNREALGQLIKGELKSTETWEAKLSSAGTVANTDEEKMDLKAAAWTGLLAGKKLGYMALLKNLRNIITQAPEAVALAIEELTDPVAIKNSLVLPFRFVTAYKEIADMPGSVHSGAVRSVMVAINKALDLSTANVPMFAGRTLVALDVSGSMTGKPADIGKLFAAILVKANNADFMTFDTDARYQHLNIGDSTTTVAASIQFTGGGTDFRPIFGRASAKYDRIIILSDMQAWVGGQTPRSEFNSYKQQYSADPFIYSFDLAGLGTLQFPERKAFAIAGFSDKIFDLMKVLEEDKNALINKIKDVDL